MASFAPPIDVHDIKLIKEWQQLDQKIHWEHYYNMHGHSTYVLLHWDLNLEFQMLVDLRVMITTSE